MLLTLVRPVMGCCNVLSAPGAASIRQSIIQGEYSGASAARQPALSASSPMYTEACQGWLMLLLSYSFEISAHSLAHDHRVRSSLYLPVRAPAYARVRRGQGLPVMAH
jgi:hypothetical protein